MNVVVANDMASVLLPAEGLQKTRINCFYPLDFEQF